MRKPITNTTTWSTTTWLLAGAGVGLVAAASTRWYWGLGAFVILAIATIAAHYMRGSSGRPAPR